jgi:diguanylate cyclase (GGDEF)-like protein
MLGTAREAHSPTDVQAQQALPVHLKGVVTYYDPYRRAYAFLFLHDATGGIFITLPARPLLPYRQGSLIEVEGVSDPGNYAPIVRMTSIRLLGEGALPAHATSVTLQQLLTGDYDSQWVQVEGVIHSVSTSGHNTMLKLATPDGAIGATTITQPGADYSGLIGARVRLRGDAVPQFNERRQMTGVHLYFAGKENIRLEQPALADPFMTPVRPVARLFRFGAGPSLLQSVHVRGRLTLQRPGQSLCLQDASGGLCVQTRQKTPLPAGSLIEVVGFPLIVNSTPTLTESLFRLVPGSAVEPVKPAALSAAEALKGNHAGELVQVEGRLISINRTPGEPALMLESGGVVFPALLTGTGKHTLEDKDLDRWREGSLLRVTGVCAMQVDAEGSEGLEAQENFASFSVLLHSPADAVVLAEPPWWNVEHTLQLLFAVIAVSFGLLTWSAIRRSYHRQQTELIRKSEERFRHLAQHDTLTGLPNRLLLHDRLEMELARARRHGSGLGLLMMDLDGFKHVNDTLGHHVGDLLLLEVGSRLRASLRAADTVARMGGDEFVVLLADMEHPTAAEEVAAKVVLALRAPLTLEGEQVSISVSVGVCTYPEGGDSVESMLRSADAAMYRAKSLGRDRFERFTQRVRANLA